MYCWMSCFCGFHLVLDPDCSGVVDRRFHYRLLEAILRLQDPRFTSLFQTRLTFLICWTLEDSHLAQHSVFSNDPYLSIFHGRSSPVSWYFDFLNCFPYLYYWDKASVTSLNLDHTSYFHGGLYHLQMNWWWLPCCFLSILCFAICLSFSQ